MFWTLKMEAACFSKTSFHFCQLHGITSQKTVLFRKEVFLLAPNIKLFREKDVKNN
jgi:hypothetical protein